MTTRVNDCADPPNTSRLQALYTPEEVAKFQSRGLDIALVVQLTNEEVHGYLVAHDEVSRWVYVDKLRGEAIPLARHFYRGRLLYTPLPARECCDS